MSTNSQIAFAPLGKTIVVAAAASAPTGIQAPVYAKFDPQNAGQFRFINAGTTTVFLGTGPSAAEATANADGGTGQRADRMESPESFAHPDHARVKPFCQEGE